ncbi:rCG45836 [Rattus norvegicus]|uniref:RCG45836 n=1 Tax=Rattus norvegicus TaxID=10116 RepID=A6JTP5_RAT|nr:rCG45836 [Rattus norvegicus]
MPACLRCARELTDSIVSSSPFNTVWAEAGRGSAQRPRTPVAQAAYLSRP